MDPQHPQPADVAGGAGHAALHALVAEAVAVRDVVVEQVRVAGAAAHPTVEVVLDRASGTAGLSLDEVAGLSGLVSAALDAEGEDVPGVGTGEYVLEVTTAGVDRPLTEPRHFARNLGRLVEVGVDGEEPVTARLLAVDDAGVELSRVRPGAKKGMPAKVLPAEHVAWPRLGSAVVQVEWTSAQEPGAEPDSAAGTAQHTEA